MELEKLTVHISKNLKTIKISAKINHRPDSKVLVDGESTLNFIPYGSGHLLFVMRTLLLYLRVTDLDCDCLFIWLRIHAWSPRSGLSL